MQRYSITFDETLKAKWLLDHTNSCSHSWKNQLQDTNPANWTLKLPRPLWHPRRQVIHGNTNTNFHWPVCRIWRERSPTRTLILKQLLRSFWFMRPKKPETWDKLCSIKLRRGWEKALNNQANGLALRRTIHPSKSQSIGAFPVNFVNLQLSGKKGNPLERLNPLADCLFQNNRRIGQCDVACNNSGPWIQLGKLFIWTECKASPIIPSARTKSGIYQRHTAL